MNETDALKNMVETEVEDNADDDFNYNLTFRDLLTTKESDLGNILGKFLFEVFSPKNASKVVVTANLGKYKFDLKVQY